MLVDVILALCGGGGRQVPTAGDILAGQGLDGVCGGVGIVVHTDAGAIALVNFVHVERGEGCVAERQGSEEEKQGGSKHLAQKGM